MAHADVTDVTDRWGQTADATMTKVICARLGDVERMIARRFRDESMPTIAQQITSTELDEDDLKQVEADAVLRIIRNLDGFYSENDGNYGYQVIQALASGKLEIPPEDWYTLGVIEEDGFFIMVPVMAAGS